MPDKRLRGAPQLSPTASSFCAAILPWLLSWPLYQGHAALDLITWSGMIFNGLVNNVMPLLLALVACTVSAAAYVGVTGSMPPQLLLPPQASSVQPLPRLLEPMRLQVVVALICITVPAIVVATALKTYDLFEA
jgi:hypothetical protein